MRLFIGSVVGGRATIQEIAKSYEKVYSTPVTLEKRGSLEDLYKTMHDKRMKSPQDIYSYMSLYVYITSLSFTVSVMN